MDIEEISDFLKILKKYKIDNYLSKCLVPLYFFIANQIYNLIEIDNGGIKNGYDPIYDNKNVIGIIRELLDELSSIFCFNDIIESTPFIPDCVISNFNKLVLCKYFLMKNQSLL